MLQVAVEDRKYVLRVPFGSNCFSIEVTLDQLEEMIEDLKDALWDLREHTEVENVRNLVALTDDPWRWDDLSTPEVNEYLRSVLLRNWLKNNPDETGANVFFSPADLIDIQDKIHGVELVEGTHESSQLVFKVGSRYFKFRGSADSWRTYTVYYWNGFEVTKVEVNEVRYE